jgi:hypothetical protein
MNNVRTMNRKIDAMLIMIIAGLLLGLAVSYSYYQSRKTSYSDNVDIAADLLAYNLPLEASKILENNINREPFSKRSLKMRKALAEICMNELNDFDKALTQLIYLKKFDNNVNNASDTENKIKYCMTRLGRVYDVERGNMIKDGINPLINTVASDTVIQLGNKNAIRLDEVKKRLVLLGIKPENITKETVSNVVNGMAQELLLSRAANRENLKEDPEVIERLKMVEKTIMVQAYLQKFVLKDVKENDEQSKIQLLTNEYSKLKNKEELKIHNDVIDKAFGFASATPSVNSNDNNGN